MASSASLLREDDGSGLTPSSFRKGSQGGISDMSSSTSGFGSIDSGSTGCQMSASSGSKTEQRVRPSLVIHTPPDGGVRAWLVMISSFLCNSIIFGIINTFGVIFVELKKQMEMDPNSSTKASLVGAMAVGATFLLSPVSGILADKYGIRRVAFIGGFLATLGMFLSAFFASRSEVLCFTYGILFGGGSSLCYTPSLVILGHYFRRRMGMVNGIVTAGSSLFSIAMPFILSYLLEAIGLSSTLFFLAGMTSLLMVAALTFKPLMPMEPDESEGNRNCLAKIVRVENWRNKKYVIWTLVVPSALFGYFVPYVHIVQYVKDILPEANGKMLLTCIAISSGVGRIIFGYVADRPRVNRIFLQQISFLSIGLCTMMLVAARYFTGVQFISLVIIALVMGIFDGCFITMLGPVAFDICGPRAASQGIGFLLGMCSIPLTVGPPIAGMLYDWQGDYTAAFLAAGVPPIVGAALMSLIYVVKGPSQDLMDSQDAESSQDSAARALIRDRSGNTLRPAATATTMLAPNDLDDDDDDEKPPSDDVVTA